MKILSLLLLCAVVMSCGKEVTEADNASMKRAAEVGVEHAVMTPEYEEFFNPKFNLDLGTEGPAEYEDGYLVYHGDFGFVKAKDGKAEVNVMLAVKNSEGKEGLATITVNLEQAGDDWKVVDYSSTDQVFFD